MLTIPKLKIKDSSDTESIKTSMIEVNKNEINTVNWPDQFPASPQVSFKIAHNGTHLFIHYFVKEDEILAKTIEDNGPVWTDSCVEFFISFGDSPYYYNAEFSCIGTALLAHRENKENAEHANRDIMKSISRYSSLDNKPFDKRQGDFEWDMLLVIPVSAYWKSGLSSFDGIKARGNFYKCGDSLTVPHYLSWNPILTSTPNFHKPDFFGELFFEAE